MPKAAFVDHSFHKKTKPVEFLKELLSKKFELDYFYDESWRGGKPPPIPELRRYDYVFYLQSIHDVRALSELKNKRLVWVPMYDGVVGMTNAQLLEFRRLPLKIIAFSKKLYERMMGLGFNCFYIQYFPNPRLFEPVHDYRDKRVYFWNRIPNINWETVKILLGDQMDSVTYVDNPDPTFKIIPPSKEEVNELGIKIYKGFLKRKKFLSLVSKANVFVAPRIYEGIGQSFLEAMARGQCVVASNTPTMNEYILDGKTGYLYNLEAPRPISLEHFEQVGRAARAYMLEGFYRFEKNKHGIINFILKEDWPAPAGKYEIFARKACSGFGDGLNKTRAKVRKFLLSFLG